MFGSKKGRIAKSIRLIGVAALAMMLAGCGTAANNGSFHSQNGGNSNSGSGDRQGVYLVFDIGKRLNGEDSTADDMQRELDILTKRAAEYSTEAVVSLNVNKTISIEIPGYEGDREELADNLSAPGELLFVKEYDAQGHKNFEYDYKETVDEDAREEIYTLEKSTDELMKGDSIILTGADVVNAEMTMTDGGYGKYYCVNLEFNAEASERFAEHTELAAKNGEMIAIVVDGAIVSAPRVNCRIDNGVAQISGLADRSEAESLASKIRMGTLPIRITLNRIEDL